MNTLRTFVLLALLVPSAFANDSGTVQATIDSWSWEDSRLEMVSPETKDAIVITIAYKKPFVVDDMDSYGIRLRKREKNTFYGYWGLGKSRCGPSGGCSGAPRLKNISKEGFQIVFDLSWSNKEFGQGEFIEHFDCKWLNDQVFTKDGFDIKVKITQNEK